MSSFNNPSLELGDRTYAAGVLLGLDGSYTLTVVCLQTRQQVYYSSSVGPGLECSIQEPMGRAAAAIVADLTEQNRRVEQA